MEKILCVEDSPDLAATVQAALSPFPVSVCRNIAEAKKQIVSERFSLMILDIALPDGSGLDFLSNLEESYRQIPVIFLTGKCDFPTKASAFSLGADDFIQKPFDPRELKLRVQARLSKASQDKSVRFTTGNLVCDLIEHRFFRVTEGKEEPIDLTAVEFRLLVLLARHPLKVFSRAEMLDRVWGSARNVTDRAIDVHLSNLRKKITGSLIEVEGIPGVGYRLLINASSSNTEGA